MSASLSVIIPVYKDDESLKRLLENLNGMDVDQIIISDGAERSYLPSDIIPSDISSICHWICAPKGRGPQIKAGIERAHIEHTRTDYIWIVHADSQLANLAPHAIRSLLSNPQNSMGTFTLSFDTHKFALNLFAWLSRWDTRLTTFGDQGFFFHRKDYESLNLDLDQFPLLEDVALRQAFKARGRIKRSNLPITTSARRFAKRGVWATQYFNAQILWRYGIHREDPAALYRDYYAPLETVKTAPANLTPTSKKTKLRRADI